MLTDADSRVRAQVRGSARRDVGVPGAQGPGQDRVRLQHVWPQGLSSLSRAARVKGVGYGIYDMAYLVKCTVS